MNFYTKLACYSDILFASIFYMAPSRDTMYMRSLFRT